MTQTAPIYLQEPELHTNPELSPVRIELPVAITTGVVLLRPGTTLPRTVPALKKSIAGWDLVPNMNSHEFETLLRSHGWHLFFLPPPVEVRAVAVNRATAMRRALRAVLLRANERRLNAVEIVGMRIRRLFRLFHVRLIANLRHTRKGPFFYDLDPNHRVRRYWDFKRIFATSGRNRTHWKAL